MQRLGGDPKRINPLVPVDLVIDHSVQVDFFGGHDSLDRNVALEFQRNRERYEFLRWGQKAFHNFRVVPPAVGIVHQVNLEYLAKGVFLRKDDAGPVAFPDTLVGTDSHTTMINGLGVLGWGVGGIEAEAVMLGQPLYMLTPEVVGFELTGDCPPAPRPPTWCSPSRRSSARKAWSTSSWSSSGPASSGMKLADRATSPTWPPNTGPRWASSPSTSRRWPTCASPAAATPKCTGRALHQGAATLLGSQADGDPAYTKVLKLDLGTIEPSLAGPKRPQDRVPLANVKKSFRQALQAPVEERGFGLGEQDLARTATVADERPQRYRSATAPW